MLDEGKKGTHGELMALEGTYARLFALQASGYEPTAEGEESPRTTTPSTRSAGR